METSAVRRSPTVRTTGRAQGARRFGHTARCTPVPNRFNHLNGTELDLPAAPSLD